MQSDTQDLLRIFISYICYSGTALLGSTILLYQVDYTWAFLMQITGRILTTAMKNFKSKQRTKLKMFVSNLLPMIEICSILVTLIQLKRDDYKFYGSYVAFFFYVVVRILKYSKHKKFQDCGGFKAKIALVFEIFLVLEAAQVLCKLQGLQPFKDWRWGDTLWPFWIALVVFTMFTLTFTIILISKCINHCLSAEDSGRDDLITFVWMGFLSQCMTANMFLFGLGVSMITDNNNKGIYFDSYQFICFTLFNFRYVNSYWQFWQPHSLEVILCIRIWIQSRFIKGGPEPQPVEQEVKATTNTPIFLKKYSNTYFRRINPRESNQSKDLEQPKTDRSHGNPVVLATNRYGEEHNLNQKMEEPSSPRDSDGNREDGTCGICLSNISNCVMLDCGHGGLCLKCALQLREKNDTCYLCREPIVEIVEVTKESTNSLYRVVPLLK